MAKNRRKNGQIREDLKKCLEMLETGASALEIQIALNLADPQLKALLAKAAMAGVAVKPASYITVRARTIPEAVRALYGAAPDAVFRFDPPDQGSKQGLVWVIPAQPAQNFKPDDAAAASGNLPPEANSSEYRDVEDPAAGDDGFDANKEEASLH
jgi:hypothetical protein